MVPKKGVDFVHRLNNTKKAKNFWKQGVFRHILNAGGVTRNTSREIHLWENSSSMCKGLLNMYVWLYFWV